MVSIIVSMDENKFFIEVQEHWLFIPNNTQTEISKRTNTFPFFGNIPLKPLLL